MVQLNMHSVNKTGVRYSLNNVTDNVTASPDPLLLQIFKGTPLLSAAQSVAPNSPLVPEPGLEKAVHMRAARVGPLVLDVPQGAVVQLVVQNFAPPGGNHPFHLHGYNFYVVGRWGRGSSGEGPVVRAGRC